MTDTMPTSEVLYRAADLIEERGWVRGFFGWQGADGGYCAEGAIAAAIGMTPKSVMFNRDPLWRCPAYAAVTAYLHWPCLWAWNDEPKRTAAEVIEVLRACAVIEASRERETAEVAS